MGLEPDEWYYFRDEARMRGRKRIDLRKDPAPELVVEIDVTHRSVPREPIDAALSDGSRILCLHLKGSAYRARKMSRAVAFLEPALLTQFIEMLPDRGETTIMRAFIA